MKGKNKNIFIMLLLFGCCLIGLKKVYADNEIVAYFDNVLANDQYTLYSDNEITDSSTLLENLSHALGNYNRTESYTDYMNQSSLHFTVSSCNYETSICNVVLNRDTYTEGNWSSSEVKNYDVEVNVVSNVSAYFPMVLGDEVVINYDESMFASEQEKENYIMNYFNSLQTSSGVNNTWFSYNKLRHELVRVEKTNGFADVVYTKKISNIVFSYTETDFSDEFNAFSTGTLSIKSDSEITTDLLSRYLGGINIGGNFFQLDGNVSNGKAYIKRVSYANDQYVVHEKHLITIVREDIDLDLFDLPGYRNYIYIAADEPEQDIKGYVSNYLGARHIFLNNNDGTTARYDHIVSWQSDDIYVVYVKSNNLGNTIDYQIHKVDARFLGYNQDVSDAYAENIGTEYVVNADVLDQGTISSALTNSSSVALLACNDDYTVCDVSLYNHDTYEIEIHQVNMVLNNVVTDEFIRAFNIKENGKIEIHLGPGISMNEVSLMYGYYDKATNTSLSYNCYSYSPTCELRYNNAETHNVEYEVVNVLSPSARFSSKVKSEVSLYPGESNPWNRLNYNYNIFSKDENEHYVRSGNCNQNTKKCAVYYLSDDGYPEAHNSDIIINEGRSPEFNEFFPGDTIKLNAIYNDEMDVYRVSLANLMSKTNTWSYIDNYNNGQGLLLYGQFESHTMNVEFAEGVAEHKAIVDEVIDSLGVQNIEIMTDDLDYINDFYYNQDDFSAGAMNFNSKIINQTISELIDNNHISYFLAVEGGAGDEYFHMVGGKMVLYYDGIAYGLSNNIVEVGINNVVYIPDDTEDSTEAHIAAAQKRIDDYFGSNSGLTVSYGGDADDAGYYFEPLNECDGNYYNLKLGNKSSSFLIIKDSSRMKTSTFSANDVVNNITVDSDNANYPTNTIVSSERINDDDSEYERLINKLKVSSAIIYDIHLYSPTIGNINDFNGIDFDVTLPIDDEDLLNKQLYAYYISDDGSIEEHPITMTDTFGQFETGHFSTYVISERVSSSIVNASNANPGTGDELFRYILLLVLSLFGLVGSGIYIKKKIIN